MNRIAALNLDSIGHNVDVGMSYLSNQLFQMAYSRYEALKNRERETQFIPQQVAAYFLREPSGKHIHFMAHYRHADRTLSKQQAENICRGMMNWVRFHLGISDNGTPVAHASHFNLSTTYQFVGPSSMDVEDVRRLFATELEMAG